MICPGCKAEVKDGSKFCSECGQHFTAEAEAPESAVTDDPPPLPEPEVKDWDQEDAPNPPAARERRSMAGGAGAAVAGGMAGPGLPPAGGQWPWRDQATELGRKIVPDAGKAGEESESTWKRMFRRMVRASLLDKRVYREVAANGNLQGESYIVALLVIALSSLGWQLLTFHIFTPEAVVSLMSIFLIQAAAWVARVWVIRFAAATWFEHDFDFKQLFRAVTYAQSPAGLQVVPVVGAFLSLWSLVTTTAAIEDLGSKDTKTAVMLTIIGALGGGIVVMVGAVMRLLF